LISGLSISLVFLVSHFVIAASACVWPSRRPEADDQSKPIAETRTRRTLSDDVHKTSDASAATPRIGSRGARRDVSGFAVTDWL
jgi:hypothetical protein